MATLKQLSEFIDEEIERVMRERHEHEMAELYRNVASVEPVKPGPCSACGKGGA